MVEHCLVYHTRLLSYAKINPFWSRLFSKPEWIFWESNLFSDYGYAFININPRFYITSVDNYGKIRAWQTPSYVTINGRRSTYFYSSIPGFMLVGKQTAGSLSKPSCGPCAAETNGDWFRKTLVTGTESINVLGAGVPTKYGKICTDISLMIRIWSIFHRTAPICEHVHTPREGPIDRRSRKRMTGHRWGNAPKSMQA